MSGDAEFLAGARARLQQLKSLHDAGRLDAATFKKERRAVEQEISTRLLAEPAAAAAPAAKAGPSKRLVAGAVSFVGAVAVAGYLATGSPSLVGDRGDRGAAVPEHSAAAAQGASGTAAGVQELAGMVDKLAARMKDRPDDAEGWTMLARSYTVLGRFAEALPAYKRAVELRPDNAGLLADYADAAAAVVRTVNNPDSLALLERALKLDPTHPKALALAGTADYDRGDYAAAIAKWEALGTRVAADSDFGKQIAASIADARAKLGGAAPPPAVAAPSPPAKPGTGMPPVPALAAAPAISGTVTLDPKLAAQAGPGDTVFVFARAAGGGRIPLAVQKARVADLPLRFKLDDSMAMAPGMTISSAKQVIVGARISKSGQATPGAGDLSGEAAPVAPGAADVAVRIDRVLATP
jgi:cytochrome c-type biogenesis protein CcmH